MLISEYDYELPSELIAQNPPEKRESSRMLVADRSTETITDDSFADFPDHLKKGDLLVINNTRVFPARLLGRSETGARIELFLVREIEDGKWEALAKPGRRLRPGKRLIFSPRLSGLVVERTEEGRFVVEFAFDGDLYEILELTGKTPLPPYIKREGEERRSDRDRYQTVYAKERGAIAAPTAGLHFTPGILDAIKDRGVTVAEITLHVGYGTFEPVRVEDLSEHEVMAEAFEINEESAEELNRAKSDGRRIVAVGTTTTRALETCMLKNDAFVGGKQVADLTITPGYKFSAIDALLTNFHLPKSSLLVLVSTFGGYDFIMKAYKHAVRERYRFYSYGDCMFIV